MAGRTKKKCIKNKILIWSVYLATVTYTVCARLIDSKGAIGVISFTGAALAAAYLMIFAYANDWIKGKRE